MTEKPSKPRTDSQRKALELYCKNVALEARENGLTIQKLLEGYIELEPTQELVKGLLRQIGKQAYGHDSTRDWSTTETTEIYEQFNRFLAQPPRNIHVPWPSIEEQMLKDLTDNSAH